MRIAHIVNHFMPELGYTEYYLAKKQQEMGHEICVITSDRYMSTSNKQYRKSGSFSEEGVKVFRLPSAIESSGNVFVPINKLKNSLINFSPDVVHIHDTLSPMGFISALCKHTIGYKIVADAITGIVIAQGLSLAIKTTLLKMYSKTIWPYVIDRIDCFFACSEAAMDWMKSELNIDPTRIRFIPLGADSDLFRFNSHERVMVRNKLGIHNNDVVAIYTGKLLSYKKIDTLFRASAPLIKTHSNYRILLVGGGPCNYVNYLKIIIKNLEISRNVIFHDAVHRTELPSFYSSADFAVWPGHHSVSIIEAMSTSLPVIIPESRWINHVLKYENGFTYPEGNVAELCKRICILLNNVELRRIMGQRSRELVEKELNWSSIAEEYLRAYDLILRKGSHYEGRFR
jgi:glycosyltransferase involved in cell wall biosynthesis